MKRLSHVNQVDGRGNNAWLADSCFLLFFIEAPLLCFEASKCRLMRDRVMRASSRQLDSFALITSIHYVILATLLRPRQTSSHQPRNSTWWRHPLAEFLQHAGSKLDIVVELIALLRWELKSNWLSSRQITNNSRPVARRKLLNERFLSIDVLRVMLFIGKWWNETKFPEVYFPPASW